MTNIAIENGPFIVDLHSYKMVMFHSLLYVYQRVFQECVKLQVDPSWETLKLVPTCSKQWGCSSTKFMSIWPLQVKKSRLAGFITYPGYTWSHKVIPIHIFHSKPSLTPKYHSLILYISPHYRMVPTYLLERKNTCEYPEPLRTAPRVQLNHQHWHRLTHGEQMI
jgi:hypothetical protein